MKIRLSAFLAALFPLTALAQTSLPPDVNSVTLSRLPPLTAADLPLPPRDLAEEAQRALRERVDYRTGPGPRHTSVYSPQGYDLGVPSGEGSPVGNRMFQLAILIAAREIDNEYEWSSHAPDGLEAGLEQSVIDIVKYDRPVTGLSEKDATVITFGRTLLREHEVSSELWQRMMSQFGRQHTMDILNIMGTYIRLGIILNAIDQHVPPHRPASESVLPPLER